MELQTPLNLHIPSVLLNRFVCVLPSRAQEALKTGHFVSVLQVLMQLQRVCNHPALVAPREASSSYVCPSLEYSTPSLVLGALHRDPWEVASKHTHTHTRCFPYIQPPYRRLSDSVALKIVGSLPCFPIRRQTCRYSISSGTRTG